MTNTEWTVETLKELMEQRFLDSDKAIQAALLAAKEAVLKAETATEKRFEASNEFRAQLSDQTATFLPRTEFNVQHKSLEEKIDVNAEAVANLRSRLDVGNPAVTALQNQEANRTGRQQGADITTGKLYAALGLSIAAISAIVSGVILIVHFG